MSLLIISVNSSTESDNDQAETVDSTEIASLARGEKKVSINTCPGTDGKRIGHEPEKVRQFGKSPSGTLETASINLIAWKQSSPTRIRSASKCWKSVTERLL